MKIFDALLRLYPAAFRRRFEAGMRYAFSREHAAAHQRGPLRLSLFWITTIAELVWLAAGLRLPGRSTMRTAFLSDWRDAWRALRATPVITTVAILSLGLGIGANTALFSVLNSLSLKTLPVRDADRLAMLEEGSWTNPLWEALRAEQQTIGDGAFAWSAESFDISMSGAAEFVDGIYVSGSMFRVLGIDAVVGRTFTEDDDRHGGGPAGPVAVISHAFWQSHYGAARDAVGRSLRINGVPFTIVGVTPRGFFGPDVGRSADIMIPLGTEQTIRGAESALNRRSSWWLNIMIKLPPGQTLEEGTARLRAIQPRLRLAVMPENRPAEERDSFMAEPWVLVSGAAGRSPLRGQFQKPLTIILIVVGLVLVIASANLASLLLARAMTRRQELSVRLALGASRLRVSRQLFSESLLLAGSGAVLGLLFALWGGRALVAQLSTWESQPQLDLGLDWRVLAFTIAVALVASVLFGLAPIAGLSGLSPIDALKQRSGASHSRVSGVRSALIVAQVALSLAIVVAAGLLTRTYMSLVTRNAGFTRNEVMIVQAELSPARVQPERRLEALERLRAAAEGVPGVAMAALSYTTPIADRGWNTRIAHPDGSTENVRTRTSWINAVSPGWFRAFGVGLIEGRNFDERDRQGATRVAIVNQTFARQYLNTEHPVGMTFKSAEPGQAVEFTVVGLANDALYRSLRATMSPTMYLPVAQWTRPSTRASISVRAHSGHPLALSQAVAAAMTREVPAARVSVRTLRDQIEASVIRERLVARLAAFFGVLAMMLAALGIYGVGAYAVSTKRREIGIRMALGANANGVVRLVLRQLGTVIAGGLLLGTALSLWSSKYVATLLYGLEPRDTTTLAAAAMTLAAVGLVAGWLPARRASRIDPTIVLRES